MVSKKVNYHIFPGPSGFYLQAPKDAHSLHKLIIFGTFDHFHPKMHVLGPL
jgi:hypothetical protein